MSTPDEFPGGEGFFRDFTPVDPADPDMLLVGELNATAAMVNEWLEQYRLFGREYADAGLRQTPGGIAPAGLREHLRGQNERYPFHRVTWDSMRHFLATAEHIEHEDGFDLASDMRHPLVMAATIHDMTYVRDASQVQNALLAWLAPRRDRENWQVRTQAMVNHLLRIDPDDPYIDRLESHLNTHIPAYDLVAGWAGFFPSETYTTMQGLVDLPMWGNTPHRYRLHALTLHHLFLDQARDELDRSTIPIRISELGLSEERFPETQAWDYLREVEILVLLRNQPTITDAVDLATTLRNPEVRVRVAGYFAEHGHQSAADHILERTENPEE